jgi:hypothetical protein
MEKSIWDFLTNRGPDSSLGTIKCAGSLRAKGQA